MIPRRTLEQIASHARAAYPAECCGLVLEDEAGLRTFCPIPNVAGTDQGRETSSRSQRDGYVMDPTALLRALDSTERQGGRLFAIVHSHPDVGAYFSAEDRRMALGDGSEPLWPGVRYLVVSVRRGAVDGARIYTWDEAHRDFSEMQLPEIAGV